MKVLSRNKMRTSGRSLRSGSGNVPQQHRHFSQQSEATTCVISDWDCDDEMELYNPNHNRYLCCCGHAHSMTGMRIVAGMLCVTVLFEVWQLIVTIFATGVMEKADVTTPAVRFLVGVLIAGSVLWAILGERAEMLIPYLLLQGAGLAVGLVFFVSFVYIALFGDKKVGTTVLRSYGISLKSNEETGYLNYAAWLMAGSFAIVIFLQIWLMCIVIACWRYLRDKRNNRQQFTPFVVFKPVKKIQLLTRMRISVSAEALGRRPSNKKWVNTRSFSASLEV